MNILGWNFTSHSKRGNPIMALFDPSHVTFFVKNRFSVQWRHFRSSGCSSPSLPLSISAFPERLLIPWELLSKISQYWQFQQNWSQNERNSITTDVPSSTPRHWNRLCDALSPLTRQSQFWPLGYVADTNRCRNWHFHTKPFSFCQNRKRYARISSSHIKSMICGICFVYISVARIDQRLKTSG